MTTVAESKLTRRTIRPLPKVVINKIAAGEVVERPSAVVKELVENALDAGADTIAIAIKKGGAQLIRIVDNGCGIDKEQIEIAFSRHATSKISGFADLDSLHTYGFRGEALPSIASVSRMRMASRTWNTQAGTEILYEAGILVSKKPIAVPPGTTVEVENLFYNTPARLKFLKAETTEARLLARTVTALAIGKYDIGFSFTVNDKLIFSVPTNQTLGERIAGVLGEKKKYVSVTGDAGFIRVEGFIGLPESAANNRNGQYLFINGRFIQSPLLSHAFAAGYKELLHPGQYPIGALLLTVPADEVDVNVHPAKTEVRLSREREIHDSLYSIIKESLRATGASTGLQGMRFTSSSGAARSTAVPTNTRLTFTQTPTPSSSVIPGVANPQPINESDMRTLFATTSAPAAEIVDTTTGEIIQPTHVETDTAKYLGRYSDVYLLMEFNHELLIIDQHAAHERIRYEEVLKSFAHQAGAGQHLLFPVTVELSPEQLTVFESSSEFLTKAGFAIAPFGGRTINIETVPIWLSHRSPEKLLIAILDDIASLRKEGHDLVKSIAQSMACRSSVMAGDKLTEREAQALLSRLLHCEQPFACPHGRPTLIKLTRADLDRQFGRV
jgi:DNA mismatch repair protein MutL